MRRGLVAAFVALCVLPAHAAAAGYEAGAAVADITPPAPGVADPAAFTPLCSLGFSGPRKWAFDEPYVDLNANGTYDDGEPYCDANVNGRHDRIWTSGAEIGNPEPAASVHDPLTARAFAVRNGTHTLVVVSVVAQGLFNTYIDQAVAAAKKLAPSIDTMVVSADHNESSPDTIGIYGGPAVAGTLPVASGIDDYYMSFLTGQIAQAAKRAVDDLQPATLHVRQVATPPSVHVELSDNWPTTDNSKDKPTAIDPKIGILQARKANGDPIFTVMSLAAHNQEIGHDANPQAQLSSDWPGYFAARIAAHGGGTGIFLVGDNGSEEDPVTVPPVAASGTFTQSQATGEALADTVLADAPAAGAIAPGDITAKRTDFCVPLENELFKAAAAAGLFGARHVFLDQAGQCIEVPGSQVPDALLTTTSVIDVGPDLQLILNPGEGFPALLLGSPWGYQDVPAECQDRANPPVPTWPSHATHRLQVGLANDFIGYEIPPWAYIGQAGAVTTTSDPSCNTGSGSTDSANHHHKLETEGVGPSASGLVATHLNDLELADGPDPTASVLAGRFVMPDGSFSRSAIGAVGARLADGTTVDGTFIDYDGDSQSTPDITTRGVLAAPSGCAARRVYIDVFPAPTPAAAHTPATCAALAPTPAPTPAATQVSTPGPTPTATATPKCVDRHKPRLHILIARLRHHRLLVVGKTTDRGCHNLPRLVRRVTIRVTGATHVLHGRKHFTLHLRARRVRRVRVTVVDTSGNRITRTVRVHR